ncbi:MAG: protein kinase [candidate division Zixibacteria bacterium]|nr:protein kinase [candidate division Zixibacteria bacterium]
MIGRTISHYKITDKLGQGGMGVVYKAEDTKLKRPVALKFLSPHMLQNAAERERFYQEAQAAAALDHPNICAVYEIDEFEGQIFIAMAFVPGSTLKDKIESGPLGASDAIDIALQIGSGLQAAHEQGIVHRDIKPENVLLTPKGQAKIMDFGLAKLGKGSALTKSGTTLGTAAYMSPEQVRSGAIDHRTDIWSLGVVLYEMIIGERPFGGDHEAAVMYAIVNDPWPSAVFRRSEAPVSLDSVLEKCLAKTPDERYGDVDETLADLREIAGASAQLSAGGAQPAPEVPALAVLPFVNMSADPENEYFSDGLSEDLITALSKLEGLRVVSRTSAFSFKGKDTDIRRIGEQLNVRTVLEGSVRRAGNRLRVTAQLINVADGFHLWSERYDREMSDVFAVQDEIAQRIVTALKVKLISRDVERLVEPATENLEAYHLYLQGRYQWNKRTQEGFAKAVAFLRQAITVDPGYALAHAALADVHILQGVYGHRSPHEVFPAARAAAQEALRLNDKLAEGHASLAHVQFLYDWKWTESEKGFRRAISLDPGYALAHLWYGLLLMTIGQLERAMAQIEEARRCDPLSLIINTDIGLIHYHARRYDAALEQYQRTLEIDENFFVTHYGIAMIHQQLGRHDLAIRAAERSLALSHGSNLVKAMLARSHALAGDRDTAMAMLTELKQTADAYVAPYSLALVHAGLREYDRAIDYLEKALADRTQYAMHFVATGDPCLDDLGDDPRFVALMKKMNLPT